MSADIRSEVDYVARELCRIESEVYGARPVRGEGEHWNVLAEPLREAWRDDARRVVKALDVYRLNHRKQPAAVKRGKGHSNG